MHHYQHTKPDLLQIQMNHRKLDLERQTVLDCSEGVEIEIDHCIVVRKLLCSKK
ncbi:hypothetical protein Syun_020443 [Stephania yunnanensis]|uniref:Uncharacterized protein n=1 Tax=Stephania yunnanensis TaxID=152371 RepID=A0AAP0IDX2_9MAGN